MTTVVTAYYNIKSKFPNEKYWSWIRNFLQIPCNLVLFTSPYMVSDFLKLRKDIHIIPLHFEELHHCKFIEEYMEEYEKDYNKSHSPELYIIWAEKVKFVQRAIEINPYKTDKFIWCDIGVVREEKLKPIINTFPKEEKIINNKMNFLQLGEFTDIDKSKDPPGQRYTTVRLGGGIHGGNISAWKQYNELWDEMLQRYFKAGRFAGQDQCIMGSIYLENPDLFHIIKPPTTYPNDRWFYLLYYWS